MTPKELHTVEARMAWIAPDGKSLVVSGTGGLRHVDLASKKSRVLVKKHRMIYPSPDGLAFVAIDKKFDSGSTATIYDAATLTAGKPSPLPLRATTSAYAVGPGGKTWAYGTFNPVHPAEDAIVVLEGTKEAAMVKQIAAPTRLAFSPDGRLLACGAGLRTSSIHLLNPPTGERIHTFPEIPDTINRVEFSPDGAALAVCAGKTLTIWDVACREVRHTFTESQSVVDAAFAANADVLAVSVAFGTVRLRRASTGAEIGSFLVGEANYGLSISADGTRLAVIVQITHDDDTICRVFDVSAFLV